MAKKKIVSKKKIIVDGIGSGIIPATDVLLHDAKCIIGSELSRYRAKTGRGVSLDLKEARVVQGYLESLVKIQREEREQSRADDLSNLSDSELLELAGKVLDSTQPKLTNKSNKSEESNKSKESESE